MSQDSEEDRGQIIKDHPAAARSCTGQHGEPTRRTESGGPGRAPVPKRRRWTLLGIARECTDSSRNAGTPVGFYSVGRQICKTLLQKQGELPPLFCFPPACPGVMRPPLRGTAHGRQSAPRLRRTRCLCLPHRHAGRDPAWTESGQIRVTLADGPWAGSRPPTLSKWSKFLRVGPDAAASSDGPSSSRRSTLSNPKDPRPNRPPPAGCTRRLLGPGS